MDKLKQRVYDVVSYKKNLRILHIKIRILEDQRLLISEENDGRNEIQQWAAHAEVILKRANDIIKGRNDVAAGNCLYSARWDPSSSWTISKMIRVINKTLREGLDLSSYFWGLSYCKNLQSREDMLQEILEASMDMYNSNMIGIYGMIGVGKTILVEELARRAQNNPFFDVVVMVQVSDSLAVKLIQTQIANKIGLQLSEADDEETRAQLLKSKLEKNVMESGQENNTRPIQQSKNLVILDGILHKIDLLNVGIPYGQKESRCRVVMISRNADVCKEMGAETNFSVECLNSDEAKTLFRERLGDKVRSMDITIGSERYQCVENFMLVNCGGLPLMINSLARALRSMSRSNWKIIAQRMERHTLFEVDELKEVPRPIFELCNKFIQSGERQRRFLVSCLIQQGDVPLATLMRYGIGFGVFRIDSSELDSVSSVDEQMNSWVDELKSLSLLMESKEPGHIKINDLVQAVAISALSQGDYCLPVLLDSDIGRHTKESYENCVAISTIPGSNFKYLNDLKLEKLEACLLQDLPRSNFPFQGMLNLKILDIRGKDSRILEDLSSSIGDLKNLVTLHLEYYTSGEERVISKICKLEKLEVLSLRGSGIETLPEEIGNLTNLRVLDLTSCSRLRNFCADAVAKLKQLREIYLCGTSIIWSIDDMKVLTSLPLEVLEIQITLGSQVPSGALKFPNLRRFAICNSLSCHTDMPHLRSCSRSLSINEYSPRSQLEESGLLDFLPWTECLQIEGNCGLMNGVGDLITQGFLHLRKMYVVSCNDMACILDPRKLNEREIFPKLEILSLENLCSLKSICYLQPHHSFFPKLRKLILWRLRQLGPYVLPIQLVETLKVLEVTDCPRLVFIFPASETNETDMVDSSVQLPCLKSLVLRDLIALNGFSEASITRVDVWDLFNEKIKLPSLKEMRLHKLSQFESLWDFSGFRETESLHSLSQTWGVEPYSRDPCFGNLKYMAVTSCAQLKSLFPTQIVNSLLQLEKLEVGSCDKMREVITSGIEDDTNPTTMITFPKLQTLKLKGLSSLQCFYRGSLPVKFPMLRELELASLGRTIIEAFSHPVQSVTMAFGHPVLFQGDQIDFPSLKHLQVSGMNLELITGHGDTNIFPDLSRLTLVNLPNLKSLPNISSNNSRVMHIREVGCFKELEELKLSGCGFLEELIYDNNSNQLNGVQLLFPLRKLNISSSRNLRKIPWNMLANLRSLIIGGRLGGWASTSLISSALLLRGSVLPVLEYIKVEKCDRLEAIISEEEQEDRDFVKYGITLFPCLRRIQLIDLPNVESFSLGSYEAHFPSLETVDISDCFSLQLFSVGTTVAPRLIESVLRAITRKSPELVRSNTIDELNVNLAELADSRLHDRDDRYAYRVKEGVTLTYIIKMWQCANEEALEAADHGVGVANGVVQAAKAETSQSADVKVRLRVAEAEVLQATAVLLGVHNNNLDQRYGLYGPTVRSLLTNDVVGAVKEASHHAKAVLEVVAETLRAATKVWHGANMESVWYAEAQVIRTTKLLRAAEKKGLRAAEALAFAVNKPHLFDSRSNQTRTAPAQRSLLLQKQWELKKAIILREGPIKRPEN